MPNPVQPSSGIYVGTLRHRRFDPVGHAFTYPLFMVLLDIDRVPSLMQVSRFTSYNRWNWAAFDERDHFGDRTLGLRQRLSLDAAGQGLTLPDGPIFLLTHLRYLGYCFNPISLFYCYSQDGTLQLVLAEVNNTFGGSHNYWLRPQEDRRTFRAAAAKSLYVSPFMQPDLGYVFALGPVADRLVAHMDVLRAGRRFFDATLTLERRPWTAGQIRRTLAAYPWMTGKVIAGIHWQALRLWWKGVPAVPRTVEP
jgi:hypothetical protein